MTKAIVWLRNDLRLSDNPALAAACKAGDTQAIYVHEQDESLRPIGAAARWWLHQSLQTLEKQLAAIGVQLSVETGRAEVVLGQAVKQSGADQVHWNRRYAPAARDLDALIKQHLRDDGVTVASHPGNVLAEPWTIETGQGKPYSVFTPFWKTLKSTHIATPLAAPNGKGVAGHKVDQDYRQPHWAEKLAPHWDIGEKAAQAKLDDFFDRNLDAYPDGRDVPAKDVTSRLSPHLRFGEISPRQIWAAAQSLAHSEPHLAGPIDKFLSELAWRDFSYHQLYHRSDIAAVPMQAKYEGLRWRHAPAQLKAWQSGQTGFPIIDAGMRELWEIGYMHNRVRMLVASLLAKNLLIDWRQGEDWFWDCLVDADEANNPASWQWVAGSGLDAAPYFRIFNPVTQGERFDANGDYVRRWVPEIADLPDKWVHAPSTAPTDILEKAGITLGKTYPRAIVDLKATRQQALDAVAAL